MKHYLLSIYQPDGPIPPPEVLEPVMRDLDALNKEMQDAGAWVFAAALFPPSSATVLQAQGGAAKGGAMVTTDGPFTEGKEHLGGFTVIAAADLDAALEWGRRLAEVLGLPIEVRPVHR